MKATIHNKNEKPELVDFGFIEDNVYYWWASWYAKVLGYKSLKTLLPTINKAKEMTIQLGLPFETNFIAAERNGINDIKLTKFSCFLISLLADSRKPVVKRARAYFLNHFEEVNQYLKGQDFLTRVAGREDLKQLNQRLAGVAKNSNVTDFSLFINEGYMGMYNMPMSELKQKRGIPSHERMNDSMTMVELSANIFRVTMTAERLKYLGKASQGLAAKEHWKIGSQIRSMVKENTGLYPEDLPTKFNLNLIEKRLLEAHNEMNQALPQNNDSPEKNTVKSKNIN